MTKHFTPYFNRILSLRKNKNNLKKKEKEMVVVTKMQRPKPVVDVATCLLPVYNNNP